eukprot:6278520-Pyramimonas_sp.AAC.2
MRHARVLRSASGPVGQWASGPVGQWASGPWASGPVGLTTTAMLYPHARACMWWALQDRLGGVLERRLAVLGPHQAQAVV